MSVQSVQSAAVRGAASGAPEGYTVRHGDTLSSIAAAHGVSLAALEQANPHILHPDLIFAGQHIHIPEAGSGGPQAPAEYTVQAGDTLSGIGDRFGVDWRLLAQINGLSNPNLIRPGQEIRLPSPASPSVSARAGATGSAGATGLAPSGPASSGAGANAATIAESYLGRNASSLKADRSDALPMDAGVPSSECCANFVSAVLVQAGQLPARLHTDSVAQLKSTLQSEGWTQVSAAAARPGDVVIMQGGGISHTELVAGNGRMVGSNNTNADGSQKVGYSSMSYAASHDGIILRAPAAAHAASGATARATASDAGDATPATLAGRTQAAVTYFEGQGWTHAQAAGIVGDLLGENGQLDPHQHEVLAGGGEGPGRGLAQWTDPSRLAAFRAYFNGRGPDQTSFREQLGYLQHELMTTEGRAAADIHAATTPAQAAAGAVEAERPANPQAAARVRGGYAEQVYRETR